MRGVENHDLAALIARLEKRNKRRQAATTVMAVLGLLGFGIMIVPVLAGSHLRLARQETEVATTTAPASSAFANLSLIGQAAIVYDLSTGEVIYEKNASEQLPLASITKLITTYAAVDALSPNAPVTITDTALNQDGDSGFAVGETFAFKDLARFALVASSNDAAEAIAEAAAGKRDVSNRSLLASAVSALGLTKTYANNGTGLDVNTRVSGGYGSAQDVAILAGALLRKAPAIAHATIEPTVTVRGYQGQVHTLPNTNQDIVRIPHPLLSKTGYTDLAGGNLAVVFDVGIDHPVAVVVLGSTHDGRFTDVERLVARTLDHFGGIAP